MRRHVWISGRDKVASTLKATLSKEVHAFPACCGWQTIAYTKASIYMDSIYWIFVWSIASISHFTSVSLMHACTHMSVHCDYRASLYMCCYRYMYMAGIFTLHKAHMWSQSWYVVTSCSIIHTWHATFMGLSLTPIIRSLKYVAHIYVHVSSLFRGTHGDTFAAHTWSTHHSPCHVCWDLLLSQVTLS